MKVLNETTLNKTRWTSFKEKKYLDNNNQEKKWSYIERNQQQEAVVIIAKTKKSGSIILINQYRVPFEKNIIEFPAGLIDKGESASQAATRELLEETGYKGTIIDESPLLCTTPGLSTESLRVLFIETEEEPSSDQKLEGSEKISVIKLKPDNISQFIEECQNNDIILDARVYLFLHQQRGI